MAVTTVSLNDDKGPRILAVLWTLTGLTGLIVAIRMFIRLRMLKKFGIDDYLIAASMVMSFAYCGVTTAGVSVGFGKHAAALTQEDFELAVLLNTVSFLFGIISFPNPELAVTSMLTRILNPGLPQKIWLWLLVGTAAAMSCICIIILFTTSKSSPDGTADLVMWTNIEADVVVIASCIPTPQPLLELIMGKRTLGSYSNSGKK